MGRGLQGCHSLGSSGWAEETEARGAWRDLAEVTPASGPEQWVSAGPGCRPHSVRHWVPSSLWLSQTELL